MEVPYSSEQPIHFNDAQNKQPNRPAESAKIRNMTVRDRPLVSRLCYICFGQVHYQRATLMLATGFALY